MKHIETIIIGAGPCGMSAAIELKNRGFDHLIIEKGNIVEAIYNYPTHQTFFSSSEKLAIGGFPFITEAHKPKRNHALVYYREATKHFDMNINTYEEVTSGRQSTEGFILETSKDTYSCTYLIIATGYYGQPNRLDVPGEHKEKVSHYFKEAHPFFKQDVLVIGGKNSSVDAAMELEKAGSVVLEKDGEVFEIPTAHVFAMVGYHPDYRFLQSFGIKINENEFGTAPLHSPETMETNVKNLYIAGVIAAGNDANTIFIEN